NVPDAIRQTLRFKLCQERREVADRRRHLSLQHLAFDFETMPVLICVQVNKSKSASGSAEETFIYHVNDSPARCLRRLFAFLNSRDYLLDRLAVNLFDDEAGTESGASGRRRWQHAPDDCSVVNDSYTS